LGNTYHVAIGQGDLTATPLQVALETAVIANGGKLCTPHLSMTENARCEMLNVKLDNINMIKEGMIAACSSEGTGVPFFKMNEDLPDEQRIACKTGTAEIGENIENTHAWFTMFDDQVVITVLLERGGSGAYDAAPVAKEIFERYHGTYQELTPTPGLL